MDEAEFEVSWPDDEDRLIEFMEGLALMPESEIRAFEPGIGDIRIHVTYDEFLNRLVADSVEVSTPPGSEVTGTSLRAVRVQEYLVAAAESMVYMRTADGRWISFVASLEGGAWPDEITADRELHAAKVYELARLANIPPLKAVAEALGVSQSTAARLITQAKRADKFRTWGDYGLAEVDPDRLVGEHWRVDHKVPTEVVEKEFARMFGAELVTDGVR